MSIKRSFLSASRVMNFITSQRVWRALAAEADFQVKTKLPKSDILVVSPHPDDEIFGCAGALSSVAESADVTIATIFSGGKKPLSALSKTREEESKQAVKLLTESRQIFYRQPDNAAVSVETIRELSKLINEHDLIFLPSFSDPNLDHRETVKALLGALKIARGHGINLQKIPIWLYEIWSPLPYFNRLLELDWREKEKAMEKFKSQLEDRNYLKAIKALNEYRGEMYGLLKPAEAFFALPADLLLKIYSEKK